MPLRRRYNLRHRRRFRRRPLMRPLRTRAYRPPFKRRRISKNLRNGEYYSTIEQAEFGVRLPAGGAVSVIEEITLNQFPRAVQISDIFEEFKVKWAKFELRPNLPRDGWWNVQPVADTNVLVTYYENRKSVTPAATYDAAVGRAFSRTHRITSSPKRFIYPKANEQRIVDTTSGTTQVDAPYNRWTKLDSNALTIAWRGVGIYIPQTVFSPEDVEKELQYQGLWTVKFMFRKRKNQ